MEKEKNDLGITNEDVLEFYWLAMEKSGWHNDGVKKHSQMFFPHEKTISFQSDKFLFVDKYETNPFSNKSTGTIKIYFLFKDEWVPVWWMSYSGEYSKEAIPFLKESLLKNIRLKKFDGGRGPKTYQKTSPQNHPLKTYTNVTNGGFKLFLGKEVISTSTGLLGFHTYQGMSLLPD